MYLRRCYRTKDGKRHAYWALVESYRTARGPRQRTVAWLGSLEGPARQGVAAALGVDRGPSLFDGPGVPGESQQVDFRSVRVERVRDFGAAWLGLEVARELELPGFLGRTMEPGRERVPWPTMALVLVLGRLLDPGSELRLAEHVYVYSAMAELLGVPAARVNDDRLYRTLDALLPHKDALQKHLKDRLGTLFDVQYDLLLYDVTSTYFEGLCAGNEQAQRGYSRDQRSDCKQVCIALVVSRCGLPLGYEIFAGNRSDVTTVQEIVGKMEQEYGKANRIWVMDRGMTSRKNVNFLGQEGRRYILGTSKSELKRYERELLKENWQAVHEGLEVKTVGSPAGSTETFILCRSKDRREKEKAMHERFVNRIEEGLRKIQTACEKKKQDPVKIAERVGRLMGRNTRGQKAFTATVATNEQGGAVLGWTRNPAWSSWASMSEGCYLLRTNIADWSPQELWRAYMNLTQAETAFRIHKSDLALRPVWHQKKERVQAHILVCFLAYVLWKTLMMRCKRAGLGDEPRKVLDELGRIKLVDVVARTCQGVELRRRCVSRPNEHQAILLHRLGLCLPEYLDVTDEGPETDVVET
jgi:transposase